MINTRRDTVRTHRCPVGLVVLLSDSCMWGTKMRRASISSHRSMGSDWSCLIVSVSQELCYQKASFLFFLAELTSNNGPATYNLFPRQSSIIIGNPRSHTALVSIKCQPFNLDPNPSVPSVHPRHLT